MYSKRRLVRASGGRGSRLGGAIRRRNLMRMTSRAAVVVAASSLGLVFMAVGSGGTAASAGQPQTGASSSNVQTNQAATLAYWTAARLKSATPVDVVAAGTTRSLAGPNGPTGKPGAVPGGAPLNATRASGGSVHPETTDPYDSFQVSIADTKLYPYELNGALFFENNGSNYVCSATSVASHDSSRAENEIWTAGHCAVNTESNNQVVDANAEFIPAYDGAKCCNNSTVAHEKKWAPFGIFTWDGGWETATAWLKNRDLSEDEAAMEVGTSDITGDTLGQAVGWDGFAWNRSVDQQFVTFGYPAGSPYNGDYMEADISATGGQDSNGGANSENPIYIGSPFTGGSSGGAWNIDWSDTGPGYINGHNDYVYLNSSGQESPADQMYSPYQDTLSNTVRCFGASSC
jgi:V8-like Glu-specific endopeptidase